MKFCSTTSVISAASILLASSSFAGEYLIAPGKSDAAFSVSFTTFDQFWAGGAKQPSVPGGGDVERLSFRGYYFYGITDSVAADVSIGYADTSTGLSDDSEFTDLTLGLAWQVLEESDAGFDWLVRAGFSIAGDYEVGVLSAPGDGENNFDLMTKVGKSFGGGLRGDLELGYTVSGGDVPDSFRLRTGPSWQIFDTVTLDVSGIYFEGIDGIDIGGPGFTGLRDLPRVEEQGLVGEVGLAFSAGSGYYRLSVSKIFDGRNIGEELTVGAFSSFRF